MDAQKYDTLQVSEANEWGLSLPGERNVIFASIHVLLRLLYKNYPIQLTKKSRRNNSETRLVSVQQLKRARQTENYKQ